MGAYKYKAFISYSHKDDRWGRWLHRRLENYPLPRNIVGNITKTGEIPKRLKPIFRDREELAAADNLGTKIEQALSNSENLIMICSPAAARSHWVNQEVLYFKRHNRGAQIFSVIVEGEPFASNMPGREDEECFPPALRYQLDEKGNLSDIPAEPLAADLRDHADGKRLGVLKLVSGMIGVGLDEVVQRDSRRQRDHLKLITVGSLTFATLMIVMTWAAIDGRNQAETSRTEAEKMVEYLITDLKKNLDTLGQLDILDNFGLRVAGYYDAIPLSNMDDDRLARQARGRHILGQVAITQGRMDHALTEVSSAYNATAEILRRNPKNRDAIFAHAQSEYWVGKIYLEQKEPKKALSYRLAYSELSEKLYNIAPDNDAYVLEYGWAENNLGFVYRRLDRYDLAKRHYENAIRVFHGASLDNPENQDFFYELAVTKQNLASMEFKYNNLASAVEYFTYAKDSFQTLVNMNSKDKRYQQDLIETKIWLQEIGLKAENNCQAEQINRLMTELEDLIQHDPSNQIWLRNYIHMSYLSAHHCDGYLNVSWLKNTISKTLKYAENIKIMDTNISKKMAWFRKYEPKLDVE